MLYKAPQPLPDKVDRLSVFLAGGISRCPDWQTDLSKVMNTEMFNVINPRRPGDLAKSGDEVKKQIEWEHKALMLCDTILFWFPKETLCPITLYELGKMLMKAKYEQDSGPSSIDIIVGWHEDYERAFDLDAQIKLMSLPHHCLEYYGPGWDKFKDVVIKRFGNENTYE